MRIILGITFKSASTIVGTLCVKLKKSSFLISHEKILLHEVIFVNRFDKL